MKDIPDLNWFDPETKATIKAWLDLAEDESSIENFVLICVGPASEAAIVSAMIRESLDGRRIAQANRTTIGQQLNANEKRPAIYVISSLPTRIQQSRLASRMNRMQGNSAVIFVEEFDKKKIEPDDPRAYRLNYKVANIAPANQPT